MEKWKKVVYLLLVCFAAAMFVMAIVTEQEVTYRQLPRIVITLTAAIGAFIGMRGNKRRSLQFYESHFEKELNGAFADNRKMKKKLLQAVRLYDEDKLEQAINALIALESRCETRQDYACVLLFLALSYSDSDMVKKSIETYRRLLRYTPSSSTAHSNLGLQLTKVGKYQEAIEAYETALQMDPDNPFAYNNLASVYFRMNEYESAIQYAKKALERKGNMYQAASVLAIIYARTGDKKLSEHYYRVAVDNGQEPKKLQNAMERG